ncbi:MAG: hypothetical protein JNN15_20635, partial [Blastocatellia bacterium]|nr:hypothetical protein [Blastocatellia bacterium]
PKTRDGTIKAEAIRNRPSEIITEKAEKASRISSLGTNPVKSIVHRRVDRYISSDPSEVIKRVCSYLFIGLTHFASNI